MAGKKKSKKAAAKKPAKKAAPKKAAKSAKAGKAAKKAAPKKAAPKKAAPKKAAAKKAAPKKAVAAKKPAVKEAPTEAIEVVEADQVETMDVETAAPESDGAPVTLRSEILAMAKQLYGDRSDDELLEFDPNSVDAMDPNNFYELIAEKYGVQADAADDNFGGFGGPIKNTIAFVESRWDGQTRKDTPMPPGDWLEEYVHPES